MSAFIVSDYQINALLSYAKNQRSGDGIRIKNDSGEFISIDASASQERMSEIGQILLNENYRSVNYRYKEKEEVPKFQFKHILSRTFSAAQILKACDCFDYQACETEDYRETLAAKIIDGVRALAIRNVPGYEDAEWGMDEPKEKNSEEMFLIGSGGLTKVY